MIGADILLPGGGRTQTDVWSTPRDLFYALNREFGFTLDPCADPGNATCARYFTPEVNGLLQDWGTESVFMNPPYSECEAWMRKAFGAAQEGATVVCLVPSRTDTEWFHRFALKGEVRFIKGRLRFGDSEANAPFASLVVVFRSAGFALRSMDRPA